LGEPRLSNSRVRFIFIFFLAALGLLILRLGFIQIFKSSNYLAIARNQSRVVVEMQPARGRIVDRFNRELALDVRRDSLYAVAKDIKNKPALAQKLARILGSDARDILRRIDRDKLFVWIARKISPTKAEEIRQLKCDELGFVKESQRVYPKGETACQLVGFTDIDNDGLEGIEFFYNSFLKGVPGWRLAQKDAKQRELISKQVEMVAPVDGYNIHLAIDEVIQSFAEKELIQTCRKFNALGGSILVIEPKSGDVLAMANYPLYDLNGARKTSTDIRRNRTVTDLFEPGSVFKLITLSGILQEKVFGLDHTFDCENGSWPVAGRVLHDVHGYGVLTFRQVIEKSSNIGTVKGAMKLGATRLYKTIRDFGFGSKTGVGLAGEINGIVPHPKAWSKSSIINIPIGQGVAVTPIQLAYAMAAIANDGLLMRPRILTHIDDADGKIIQDFEPVEVRRAISKETAIQVRSVLEGVVARGTGKKAAVPGFKAAGKTGTAQKLMPGGGYSNDKFIASFVGFVPYDQPKVVITVSIDEPHPVYYGGEVAAPAFSRLASQIMAYWQISPPAIPEGVVSASLPPSPKDVKKNTPKKLVAMRSSGAPLARVNQ